MPGEPSAGRDNAGLLHAAGPA